MHRYILMYRGSGQKPSAVLRLLTESDDLKLIDHFGDNLIISGETEAVKQLSKKIGGWIVSRERHVRHPQLAAIGLS
jgi:hypothetical protein